MRTLQTLTKVTLIGATVAAFAGCADMTPKQRNTAIGAGAGAWAAPSSPKAVRWVRWVARPWAA